MTSRVSKRIENYRKNLKHIKFAKLKFKCGDKVKVICGDDKGKEGEVLRIFRKKSSAVIKGINLHKKVVPSKDGARKVFASVELPVHISNMKKI